MEVKSDTRRISTSSRDSSLSASVTVVGTNSTPNSPPATHCTSPRPTFTSSNVPHESGNLGNISEEPELGSDPIRGWPQLASLMGKTPDFAAFPRFRDLNIKSLLYYQCQLTILREKLHKLEYEDAARGEEWNSYADDLVEQTNSEQFKTIKEMRIVLKEYNEALLQYTQVCALPEPEPFNMRTLQKWLRNKKCGNFLVKGRGELGCTWGNVYENPDKDIGGLWKRFRSVLWGLVWTRSPRASNLDLAVTTPKVEVDGLTRWVAIELIPFCRALYNRWKKTRLHDLEMKVRRPTVREPEQVKKQATLVSWSEKGPLRATSTISTLVACLMPVVAISVLSQLHGTRNLLFCLAGFALLFALGLIFLTQGTSKRTEVFAATAAFSAVMVVFISTPPPPIVVLPPGQSVASA